MNQYHDEFEQTIREFLTARDFLTDQSTYHAALRPETAAELSRRYSPTALYIRGRADRIAIHRFLPLEFEWEAKTTDKKWHRNLAIEAYPLIHHIMKARTGVRCLYAYWNPHTGAEAGFWTHQIPRIREIKLPNRWSEAQRTWFKRLFAQYLPGIYVDDQCEANGSKDPFVIIDGTTVHALADWRQLIDEAIAATEAKRLTG